LDEPQPNKSSIILAFDEDSGKLQAQFDPLEGQSAPDRAILMAAIQDRGFANYFLEEKILASFIKACSYAKQLVLMDIGERRDAEFSLELAADFMSAWLTLNPAQGGKPIGAAVNSALRDQGVSHGILHLELDAALAKGTCDHLLIAKGESEQDGTPGWFEILFGLQDDNGEEVDELAVIKFSDLSHLLIVHPGDALMRRVPPVPGKNGLNIKGEVILAKAMPEIPFGLNLQGAAPDRADPNLLITINAGQPVAVKDGVMVNPVIEVPDVDLSTGNIVFEGTIHIEGDIKAGMSLNVTGDVIVKGMVESAEIIAGGNVAVKGGIIGSAEKKQGSQALAGTTARIHCGGSVQAMFMENVHVEAGDSIQIDMNARQCELIARNQIVVGKKDPKSGQIIGGRAQAGLLIEAVTLGTTSAMKTVIEVGVDPYLGKQIVIKQALLQRKIAELDQVLKLVIFFEHHPEKNIGGVAEKVEEKRLHELAQIANIQAELTLLEEQLELVNHARVKVGKVIYDGVEIQIGKQIWRVVEDTHGGVYQLQEGKIIVV
jgi:uncharacterized protein (DUF342 family)